MKEKNHWEKVYSSKSEDEISWFQEHAEVSVRLIEQTGAPKSANIIDVGGGASTLVDDLLHKGYRNLTVLDLSGAALAKARSRLGAETDEVHWLEANILEINLPEQAYDIWHDRAVFHFLTAAGDRQKYVQKVLRSVKPGGHVIVATFAEDGPEKCSGLPAMRYSGEQLHGEFGAPFDLLGQEREEHHTPAGVVQRFVYCFCRKLD